jgi:hypothetical protein
MINQPMPSNDGNTLAAELFERAEQQFGKERSEALRADLLQMARELAALDAYKLDFVDEP